MGLATEIVKFFYINNNAKKAVTKTIEDFSNSKPEWNETLNLEEVFKLCSQLENHGYIVEAKSDHNHPIMGRSFVSFRYDNRTADYGEYDFIGYGFPKIRERLGLSARPVIVTKTDGSEDIGTSFLLGNHCTIATARHVIDNMDEVRILDTDNKPIHAERIVVSENNNLDIAIILAKHNITAPFLRSAEPQILDEVICLGFPPIPGFEELLISDSASINANLKSSHGRNVAHGSSYLDNQSYFLINARVKGGNSGGPIINRKGHVVGILIQTSMSAEKANQLDTLGYGIATPSTPSSAVCA